MLDLTSNVKQTVYTYDANGNRITKTAEGKTETNIYDGLNQLIGFTDSEATAMEPYNAFATIIYSGDEAVLGLYRRRVDEANIYTDDIYERTYSDWPE